MTERKIADLCEFVNCENCENCGLKSSLVPIDTC